MTEFEEYQQTGMLGGYKPELIRGTEVCGKIIPYYRDDVGVCSEDGAVGLTHSVYIDGVLFHVSSMFDVSPAKTPTEAMLSVIDADLEKESSLG